jgi:1,2-diacylglycerol 3-beta-galactosyltransferase
MTRVDIVWFNAGGGHRAAAQALEQQIVAQGLPWRVRRVNLTEVLDPSAMFRRLTGLAPEDLYNKRLASGFTLGLAQELKLLQALIRLGHPTLVQRLARFWAPEPPDLVVSVIPNFNRALHDALGAARPQAPFATVLTDMADHPPAFWIEPATRQHVICGTAHAQAQARSAGVPERRVHRVQGMMLRPEFHLGPCPDREARRAALGLPARAPVGLVLFGGAGSRVMRRIAARLPDMPLVLLCGRNEALAAELRRQPARAARVVVGFTADVAGWMRLADFFIGKPGPGSLSEAVQCGLPVIVTRNAWTMPQERWNTEWVSSQGLGVVVRSFARVDRAVDELLAGWPGFRARVAATPNRAVFEVPGVLQQILQHAGTLPPHAADCGQPRRFAPPAPALAGAAQHDAGAQPQPQPQPQPQG